MCTAPIKGRSSTYPVIKRKLSNAALFNESGKKNLHDQTHVTEISFTLNKFKIAKIFDNRKIIHHGLCHAGQARPSSEVIIRM